MLKEILLTDDERDTILGLCQVQLQNLKMTTYGVSVIRKLVCARLGIIICKVKGHVPHDNVKYLLCKMHSTLPDTIFTCPRNTVTLTKDKYEFRKEPDPTLLEDTITPKERRDKLIEEGKWAGRLGTWEKPGTSPL